MKKLATVFLLFSILASAQTKGIVVDENNKPIPYVNIWVENENIGATSEENGKFIINIEDKNKILVLSSLGFETKKIKVSEAEKVVIKTKATQLREVLVEKSKGIIINQIAKFDKDKIHFSYGGGLIEESKKKWWALAKFFPYSDTTAATPFLKKIVFNTKSRKRKSFIKMRIIEADENGFPGNDILEEGIIVEAKKGNKDNEIDVSKLNLKIDKKGFFVAFEFLEIEENETQLSYRCDFDPGIGAIPSETSTTWFLNKKWTNRTRRNPYNYPDQREYYNKYIELAVSLILTN